MPVSIKEFEQFLKHIPAQGMALDSRMIMPGDLFIAVSGQQQDGRAFINQAIQKGAIAVLLESQDNLPDLNVPVLKISDLKNKIGQIAACFFKTPLDQMQFIGVTGTNGKTTTTHWIAHLLGSAKVPCGIIGTQGYGFLDALTLGTHTTPDPVSLYRQIHALYQQNATAIAMEVSSHALSQARVQGLRFETGVFTNLGHDHLDYHGTQAEYLREKEKLFENYTDKNAVFNIDDPMGRQMFEKFKQDSKLNCYGVSLSLLEKLEISDRGLCAKIVSPFGTGFLEAPILGEFNLTNLLMAITVASLHGVPFQTILERTKSLKAIPGRMERFCEKTAPQVVVDYAHTPEALRLVLQALRPHCTGQLWCVFGCGGDRDREKRPKMVKIAQAFSDRVILTQDNPRTEGLEQIFSDMLKGSEDPDLISIELDRTNAINLAIQVAKTQDCILIAGKGDEPFHLVEGKRIPYQDSAVVLQALARRTKVYV